MPSSEARFRVVYSEAVRTKLEEILSQARAAGKLVPVVRAALMIDKRLRSNPLDFGELKSRLKQMGLKVHVGCVRPLLVEFGIQEKKKIVFVKRIQSLTRLEL